MSSGKEAKVTCGEILVEKASSDALLRLEAGSGAYEARIDLYADSAEDNIDQWHISAREDNSLYFTNYTDDRLSIASNGTLTGSASNDISDQDLKENIENVENGLDTIKKLQGRSFTWKEDAKMQSGKKYGLIAQELEKVLPELVYDGSGIRKREDGSYYKSITMNGVIPFLIEAVKELSVKVEELEKK